MDIIRVLGLSTGSASRARSIEASNGIRIAAIKWEIYSSLQNLLDSLVMIVADLGLVKPSTYGELGVLLRESGVLNEADAELIRKVAATRNVFAHAYRAIESDDIIGVVGNLLPRVEELCKFLIGYVRDSNLDPEEGYPSKCTETFNKNGVKLAYLFGSRAKGTSRDESDYDFAVFLGRKVTVEDEVKLMLDLAEALGVSVDKVDVVALDRSDRELVYRVLREGKLLYASSEEFRRAWERNSLIEALESRDIYNIYMKRVKKC